MRRMRTTKKITGHAAVLAALLLLALLAGCDRKPKAAPQQQAPMVSVVTVEPQKLLLTTELSGRTTAYLIAEIRPRVSGLIQKRLFVEGSDVTAGQVLYQIDPAPFQADLNNTQAALGRAEAEFPALLLRAERYKKLLDDAALSQQDYDDAAASKNQQQAYIKSLQATVDTARINLGYTRVTAPISGRIGKSSVTDGAIVTAYQATPLSTIQQLDPIYVDVPQSTTELLRIKSRMEQGLLNPHEPDQNKVKLTLENGAPYDQEGTLQFRDVTVDPSTGAVTLRAVFPNPKHLLLPGMFVKVVVSEGVNEQAMLVPQQGVSRDQKGNPYSLIVDAENKVQLRQLTLDRAVGDKWLASSGLNAGDRVIVEGLQMLRPGTTVQATPFQQPGAAKTAAPAADAKP